MSLQELHTSTKLPCVCWGQYTVVTVSYTSPHLATCCSQSLLNYLGTPQCCTEPSIYPLKDKKSLKMNTLFVCIHKYTLTKGKTLSSNGGKQWLPILCPWGSKHIFLLYLTSSIFGQYFPDGSLDKHQCLLNLED